MSLIDIFDDIGGSLDFLDWLESWATFAVSPVSKRAKYKRLDLVQYRIPRADKMEELGKRAVNLTETMQYLKRFGVIVKCNGFSSTEMHFQIRRNQAKWANTLLDVDADGIPQLDYGRKNWKEKAEELKRQRKAEQQEHQRALSWLDKLAKGILG